MMERSLSKDEILSTKDIETRSVKIPEWGGTVYVKIMTGFERQRFQNSFGPSGKTPDDMMERLIVLTCVDEHGNKLFIEADIKELSKKSSQALARVFEVSAELNGLTQDSINKAKKK